MNLELVTTQLPLCKLWYHRYMHNYTICVWFLSPSSYIFRYCHYLREPTLSFHQNMQQYTIYNMHIFVLVLTLWRRNYFF